jgi:hypothetical protein
LTWFLVRNAPEIWEMVSPSGMENQNLVGRHLPSRFRRSQFLLSPRVSMRRRETGCQKVTESAKKCQKVPNKRQSKPPGRSLTWFLVGTAPKIREVSSSTRMANQNQMRSADF